jgi:hypothetical protein
MISAPACTAQAYGSRGTYVSPDFERHAVDDGYRRGFDEGRDDARHHRSFSLERHGEYRDAARNYRGDSEHDIYKRGFRRGFESGYREGFDRVARGGDWR